MYLTGYDPEGRERITSAWERTLIRVGKNFSKKSNFDEEINDHSKIRRFKASEVAASIIKELSLTIFQQTIELKMRVWFAFQR